MLSSSASVLVTGASSGIGAALARQLASPGRPLILVGRDEARLTSVAHDCTEKGAACSGVSADIQDLVGFSEILESVQRETAVDVLILNAGILDGRKAGEIIESAETAETVLQINLLAAINAIHDVLPSMLKRQQGKIVLVSSLAALIPLSDAPAYSASKAALLSYGLALRAAVAPSGIQVSVACPGYVATRMSSIHQGPRPDELTASAAARIIVRGLERNLAIIGFPSIPYWLTRLSVLFPEKVRQRGMQGQRFHVGSAG